VGAAADDRGRHLGLPATEDDQKKMNPKRLIPYVVIFVVLMGAYAVLLWYQGRKTEKEEQAKQVYNLKEGEIGEVALIKGKDQIRLVKKDNQWDLTKPLEAKADQAQATNLVEVLVGLHKERTLGPEADKPAFGIDQPILVVSFTAKGTPHQLTIGAEAPGENAGYYALKDDDPNLFLISRGSKDSLDLSLTALRDKTLIAFKPAEIKSIKIKTGPTEVQLERTGLAAWNWVGRPGFKVRGDRVEALLRDLESARVSDFLAKQPENLQAAGLAPQPQTEITLVSDQGQVGLWLGAKKDNGVYARTGPAAPVVVANKNLGEDIAKAVSSLEDRRLFAGPLAEVHKIVWGTAAKQWTAVKEAQKWKLTGPEKAVVEQPGIRVEMALRSLQNLEYDKLLPATGLAAGAEAYKIELFDAGGKPLFQLSEVGAAGKDEVKVLARQGEKTEAAAVAQQQFLQMQGQLVRLTALPPKLPK
jgi:hypothetical protein